MGNKQMWGAFCIILYEKRRGREKRKKEKKRHLSLSQCRWQFPRQREPSCCQKKESRGCLNKELRNLNQRNNPIKIWKTKKYDSIKKSEFYSTFNGCFVLRCMSCLFQNIIMSLLYCFHYQNSLLRSSVIFMVSVSTVNLNFLFVFYSKKQGLYSFVVGFDGF